MSNDQPRIRLFADKKQIENCKRVLQNNRNAINQLSRILRQEQLALLRPFFKYLSTTQKRKQYE